MSAHGKVTDNIIIDKVTGEPKRIKRLDKKRIDRGSKHSGGWNKSGKKARQKNPNFYTTKSQRRNSIIKKLDNPTS